MNTAGLTFFAIAAVAMLTDWWAVSSGRRHVERIAKPSVMVALVAAAVVIDMEPSALRPWIIAALVGGLIGDVMLLPEVDRFLFGLGAFLCGHLCYVVAFSLDWNPGWLIAAGLVGLAAMVAAAGAPILRAVASTAMFVPVAAYFAVSVAVVLVAAASGRWLLFAGALTFATSDSILGHDRFVDPDADHRTAVHVTYHLGQAAIVLGTLP